MENRLASGLWCFTNWFKYGFWCFTNWFKYGLWCFTNWFKYGFWCFTNWPSSALTQNGPNLGWVKDDQLAKADSKIWLTHLGLKIGLWFMMIFIIFTMRIAPFYGATLFSALQFPDLPRLPKAFLSTAAPELETADVPDVHPAPRIAAIAEGMERNSSLVKTTNNRSTLINLGKFDHDLTVRPHWKLWLVREIITFYGLNSGWWNIIIYPDQWSWMILDLHHTWQVLHNLIDMGGWNLVISWL